MSLWCKTSLPPSPRPPLQLSLLHTNTTTYYILLNTTYYILHTTYYILLTTYYLQLTRYYLLRDGLQRVLHTTYCLLLTTYYILHTTTHRCKMESYKTSEDYETAYSEFVIKVLTSTHGDAYLVHALIQKLGK